MSNVVNNRAQARYELEENGHTAFATYRVGNGQLAIDYVFSPPELRGTGTAGRLMAGVMAEAKAENLKVYPVCSYAVAWLNRHPEYAAQRA